MAGRFGKLRLIITNSHPELGKRVAERLGVEPLGMELGDFPNKELNIRRIGDVSGEDVCIFSSLHSRYETLKELRLICDSLKNTARIFGIFPFVKDGKSDHVKRYGESVAYADTAFQISSSGIKLAVIFDQHSAQHPYFYDTRHYRLRIVHHLYLMRILIEHAKEEIGYDGIIGLDAGGFKRNNKVAEILKCTDISFIIKHRDPDTREVDISKSIIIGNVEGKRLLAFDDFIQEGGTTAVGAKIAKAKGAKSIEMLVVHNDFSKNTFNKLNPLLEDGTIDKIHIVETLPLIKKEKWHPNLNVVCPSKFIAKVIDHVNNEKHMRSFFLDMS